MSVQGCLPPHNFTVRRLDFPIGNGSLSHDPGINPHQDFQLTVGGKRAAVSEWS
jgi:hypothetical protein